MGAAFLASGDAAPNRIKSVPANKQAALLKNSGPCPNKHCPAMIRPVLPVLFRSCRKVTQSCRFFCFPARQDTRRTNREDHPTGREVELSAGLPAPPTGRPARATGPEKNRQGRKFLSRAKKSTENSSTLSADAVSNRAIAKLPCKSQRLKTAAPANALPASFDRHSFQHRVVNQPQRRAPSAL